MDLKDAAERARTANRNKRQEDIQKEEGNNGNDNPGCILFFVLFITGIVLGVRHVNAEPELLKSKWFFYFAFGIGSLIAAIILQSIVGAIFPVFKAAPSEKGADENKLSPEDEAKKEELLKALGAGKKKFSDKEWLFALALDAQYPITKEIFEKGIPSFNEKFSDIQCSGLDNKVWSIEFDGCHCQLMVNPAPMPDGFYSDTFPHSMFTDEEKDKFLKHKSFINFTFHSKKKNPKVRYLQAYAVISCFQNHLVGILNSTVAGLFSPQTVKVIKENKLGMLQPMCYTHINELKKHDGTAWYVSRGNFLFGFPDLAILGPAGNAAQTAILLNGIVNMATELKLEFSEGSIIDVPGAAKFKLANVYEYEDYIEMYGHKVLALVGEDQNIPEKQSASNIEVNSISNSDEEEAQNQKMIEWIEHPAEFNRPPSEIKVQRKIHCQWPGFDDDINIYFHEFKMEDGSEHLGISGPIQWAFRGSNLKDFSEDEQKWIFAGWFMTWLIDNGHMPGKAPEEDKNELALSLVEKFEGVTSAEIVSKLNCQDGHLFYVIQLNREETGNYVLFELSNISGGGFLEIEMDKWQDNELDPIYYCIGKSLFEGGVDPK